MSADVFHQTDHRVRFEWGEEGMRQLAPRSAVVVVIDVLRFTTSVDMAVSRDAAVFPYRYRDESARTFARSVEAVLASGQAGGPTLSPAALSSLPRGSRIVLPSPNGSTCTVIAQEANVPTLAACLRNAGAVAAHVQRHYPGGAITVIACGEQWPGGALRPALEDLIGAGAVLSRFDSALLSPEARAAVSAYVQVQGGVPSALKESSSGRELIQKGFARDVELAGEVDVSRTVPGVVDGAYRRLL